MLRPRRGLPRLIRALVLTVVVLGLASAAHVVGGAALPSNGSLGILALVALPFALAATAARLRAVPTAVGLVLAQAGGHVALVALESARTMTAACSGHAVHGAGAVAPPDCVAAAAQHPATHALVPSPTMLLAHAVAAALAGWLVARADAVLWRVVRWLVRPLRPVALPVCRALAAVSPAQVPVPAPERGSRWGRAPPQRVC